MDVNGMDRRSQGESTYVNSLSAATIPPASSPTIGRKSVNSAEQVRSSSYQADRGSRSPRNETDRLRSSANP